MRKPFRKIIRIESFGKDLFWICHLECKHLAYHSVFIKIPRHKHCRECFMAQEIKNPPKLWNQKG